MGNSRWLLAFIAILCSAISSHAENILSGRLSAIALEAGMLAPALILPAQPEAKVVPADTGVLFIRNDDKHKSLFFNDAKENRFEQLKKIYTQSAQPTRQDLTGWFLADVFIPNLSEDFLGSPTEACWWVSKDERSITMARYSHLKRTFDYLPLRLLTFLVEGSLVSTAETDGLLFFQESASLTP